MKFPRPAHRAPLVVACLFVPACVWSHLDALGSSAGPARVEIPDATSDSEKPDTTPESAVADVISEPETADTMADSPMMDTDTIAADGADGPSTPACVSGVPAVRQWRFDATVEGWTVVTEPGTKGTLSWSGAMGYAAPAGALEFDGTPGTKNGAWLQYNVPLGDLSQRVASAWVWLDYGTSPHLKFFVQTGTNYAWVDGGTVVLAPHTWTCIALDISAGRSDQPNYDPTNVIRLGFETHGTDPFRLYVDDVRY